jgi:rubredoxin
MMAKYQCSACYFPYEESEGLADEDIAAGTAWADLPADWVCPDCGNPKEAFTMVETD